MTLLQVFVQKLLYTLYVVICWRKLCSQFVAFGASGVKATAEVANLIAQNRCAAVYLHVM